LAAGHEAEKVRIAVWDSTELEPGQTIPAISRELKAAYKRPTLEVFFEGKPPVEEAYVEKGAVTLKGIGGGADTAGEGRRSHNEPTLHKTRKTTKRVQGRFNEATERLRKLLAWATWTLWAFHFVG
jgi:hypothetical protein